MKRAMSDTLGLVTLVLVVLGWGATHVLSEARERRKDDRKRIDTSLELLDKAQTDAVNFHTSASFDSALSFSLIARLSKLERGLARLPLSNQDALNAYIIRHRRAITLENFDASSFKQLSPTDILLSDINSSTADLENEIEQQYVIRYPSKFPYFRLLK
jgi:hypothetical protein